MTTRTHEEQIEFDAAALITEMKGGVSPKGWSINDGKLTKDTK
jgi:hypothetical protein